MQRLLVSLSMMLLVSACQPLSVSTQADPYADFSQYRSFDWLAEKETPSAAKVLLEKQFKFVVERELQGRGIIKDVQNPDFLIGFYANQEQKSSERTIESVNYWGGRGRYPLYEDPRYLSSKQRLLYPAYNPAYSRSSETRTIEYQQSSMVIDFVDSESKQLIWQATVQGVVDEQDPVGQLDKAVMKALKQFPPQK
jgi:hypothetical protein